MLLTQEEADGIIAEAYRLKGLNYKAKYRLGQAIWSILPENITNKFSGTVHDFFYGEDDENVIKVFLDKYVVKYYKFETKAREIAKKLDENVFYRRRDFQYTSENVERTRS